MFKIFKVKIKATLPHELLNVPITPWILTRMEGGYMLRDSVVFEHVQKGGLARIVQTQEYQFARFLGQT